MRQKDRIEKFVEENRNRFDGEGPGSGVWQRLQERLAAEDEGRRSKVRRFRRKRWSSVAAILVLCISMAAFVRTFQISGQGIDASIPADLRNAQAFYENRISLQIDRIKSVTRWNNREDTALWQTFIRPDEEYRRLRKALRENPGDQHVRAAFVEYYRSRLVVLNRIEDHLSEKTEPDKPAEDSASR